MRTIEFTSRFNRDFKRVRRGPLGGVFQSELQHVVELLASDTPLPIKNNDHPLSGDWNGFRDCHIRPNLVLIYRKYETAMLELTRLGSHSELFKK